MKLKYLIIGLVISIGFTFCFVSCEAEDAVAERGANLSTQDTTTSITTSETEEVIELIEETDIYSDYTLTDEFELDEYNVEMYRCNNEADNYQIDWRNKKTDEITSVITGSSLLMVTSAGYVFEEIYDEENYKVHGYNQGELLLDIIVDEVDLNDERPMAINPQYRKSEEEIIEEDFRLEMSDVIKLYKFSDYDGIVFGRYVRDFPMDEDVFISLIEEEMEYLLTSLGIGGTLSLKLVDIDNNGIPELCNYSMRMGARPFYNLECIDYSKGERTQYNVSINGIDTNDLRVLYVNSIFKKKNAHGIEMFYLDCYYFAKYYSYMGFPSHSCTGIFILELEEEIETGNLSMVWSPIVRKIEYETIIYEMFDEKTGTLIETNEEEYDKYYEEFKSIGDINYLNITDDVHYRLTYENDEQFELTKQSIINSSKRTILNMAQKYIHLYKISEYNEPLEIRFAKQKFIDSMEKATEYFVENFEVPPLWCFLMDITSDGMPELFLPYPTNGAGSFQMYDISGDTIKFVASDLGTPTFRNYVNILTGKPVCVGEWQWIDYDNNYICTDTYEVITYSGDTFGQSHIIDDWWSPSGIYTNGMVRKNLTQIAIEKYSNNTEPNYQISKYINTTLRETEILERIAGKSENEYISVTKEEYETALSKYYSLLYEIELPYAEATQTGNVLDENEIRKVFAELTDAYIESCEIIAETQDEWLVFDIGND